MRMLLVAMLAALAVPTLAYAHGESGAGYTSTVTRIHNGGGIEATASGDGHFTFTAPSGKTVVVNGYSQEPYVKFEDGTIYVNRRAPTTYVNDEVAAPADASAKAEAEWVVRDKGLTYTWHDHRTHWMAHDPPAAVQAEPKKHHHVFDWHVGGAVDGAPFVVEGALEWNPGKSGPGYEWLSFLVIAGAVFYITFVLVGRRRRGGAPTAA